MQALKELLRTIISYSKWRTIFALILIAASLYYGWQWVWGALFLLWTFRAWRTNSVYVVETLARDDHPFLFWIIIILWATLSLYLIFADLIMMLGGVPHVYS
ncbi:hypothetical protein PSE_2430 [Pseudovibrio sp. FO-BEG1]|uniref:hypothetical protein n=1 Tax=Pseudovibrio sp. (strain FO-BEG1) TaxID=911045 RepID=UPI000238D005|nr:hypothetical protein [Pseudovibrio sp. FO-BEG1]AEV36938.1 hypothetical protein PSE_2430 [Pseudovibrio sp. FO-BEG1]